MFFFPPPPYFEIPHSLHSPATRRFIASTRALVDLRAWSWTWKQISILPAGRRSSSDSAACSASFAPIPHPPSHSVAIEAENYGGGGGGGRGHDLRIRFQDSLRTTISATAILRDDIKHRPSRSESHRSSLQLRHRSRCQHPAFVFLYPGFRPQPLAVLQCIFYVRGRRTNSPTELILHFVSSTAVASANPPNAYPSSPLLLHILIF